MEYYQAELPTRPVLSQVAPGSVYAQMPQSAPETGDAFDAVLQDVRDIVLPGLTHWQSPSFFA